MLRYIIKVAIAVVLGIVVSLWVAHNTFDKPHTHYYNPAATTVDFIPTSAATPSPTTVPAPTTTTTVKAAPVAAQAAPVAPSSVTPVAPPSNTLTAQQIYEHCLAAMSSPAACASLVPAAWTGPRPVDQAPPAACPASGVQTEEHTTYNPATGNSTVEWQNVYCGLAQPGYEWCPPKLTFPGEPVQTGLDYARCEA